MAIIKLPCRYFYSKISAALNLGQRSSFCRLSKMLRTLDYECSSITGTSVSFHLSPLNFREQSIRGCRISIKQEDRERVISSVTCCLLDTTSVALKLTLAGANILTWIEVELMRSYWQFMGSGEKQVIFL